VGEAFADADKTHAIAARVIDRTAVAYDVTGVRADGRTVSIPGAWVSKALSTVAHAAGRDGDLIAHDGAGAVRIVRGDGKGTLVLRPVRRSGGAQEGPVEPSASVEPEEASKGVERAVERHVGALEEDAADETVNAAVTALGRAGVTLATVTNVPGDWSAEGAFVSVTRRAGRVRVQEYTQGRPVEPAEGMSAGRRARVREGRNEALDHAARMLRAAGWTVMVQEDRTAGTRCVRSLEAEPPAVPVESVA
jgi:hypothetical protein